jgi:hypothetical protein
MRVIRNTLLPLVMAALAACSSGSGNNNNQAPTPPPPPPPAPTVEPAELRVTHASHNAPDVNVYVNGDLALEAVPFRASSGLISIAEPGTLEVEVRGILPDGSEVTVIGPVDITLSEGERTDVIAYDSLFTEGGDINIKAELLEPVEIESGIDDVRVSVFHGAPAAGEVDIYVTGPDEGLEGATPITLAFSAAAGPVALMPATDYRVRITPTGDATVVYDSGTLNFAAGTELVLVAINNVYKVGANPVTLLAVGAEGANEVLDPNMGAEVRVVHNSADTPAVDVLVDGARVLSNVPFPAASNYDDIQAPAGTYNVVVAASVDNSIAPINVDLELENAASYTAIAVGSFAQDTIDAVLRQDDRRSIATAARVEVIHGSFLVASEIPVDVYLTEDGVIADAEPAISGLAYPESTGQIDLPPGSYWVTVTAAGDRSVVAFDSGAAIPLDAGTNYTVIARDPSAEEVVGNPLIQLTILTD